VSGRDRDTDLDFDELVRLAADGDQVALGALVRDLQHSMYRLALRFLGHPHDAEDATREILIRIVTHLGSFEARARFTTWADTVATRSLLRAKRGTNEVAIAGADEFAALLDRAWYGPEGATIAVAELDVRVGGVRRVCMHVETPRGSWRCGSPASTSRWSRRDVSSTRTR
jgi:DNA-directed RNA polymerase specialized sigma24 family protein